MQTEMGGYKTEEQLQEEAAAMKKSLLREKQLTKKLRDAVRQQVQQLSHQIEKRKKDIAGNDAMKRVDALEQKLRTYTQTVLQLSEFINTRKRESDYEGVAKEVASITADINAFIVTQSNPKTRAAAAAAAAAAGGGSLPF